MLGFFRAGAGTVPAGAPASILIRQLFAYQRIALAAAASARVSFALSTQDLTLFDAAGSPVVYPGAYDILITDGVSSPIVIPITVSP